MIIRHCEGEEGNREAISLLANNNCVPMRRLMMFVPMLYCYTSSSNMLGALRELLCSDASSNNVMFSLCAVKGEISARYEMDRRQVHVHVYRNNGRRRITMHSRQSRLHDLGIMTPDSGCREQMGNCDGTVWPNHKNQMQATALFSTAVTKFDFKQQSSNLVHLYYSIRKRLLWLRNRTWSALSRGLDNLGTYWWTH